jgi:predicted RNA binding protein YcfA (HicA-like mRNA interferase family)
MSPIDYKRLRKVTVREFINALERDSFTKHHQVGSHITYKHPDGRRVDVSFHHPGDTFPPKTLKRMIEHDARWDEEDLKRVRLLR